MRRTSTRFPSAKGPVSRPPVLTLTPTRSTMAFRTQGPHAGDMPNFTVKANGTAKATLVDPRVNLGEGDHSLFTNGGTALVIHAKADDMKSQTRRVMRETELLAA